ncbi:MAG TPA: protein kinase [Polyangiaceae bacterium]|jgi:serine/threonine-protein kinase|nr:protein kinase [Polyangiaceae bacterium]
MYPQVFGKYVLERELARGGMARVVLATLRGAGGFEKKLVVKQIRDELACDDDFVRRFVDEAKTTVTLAHPNIVPVYELGVERGTYFLAMEFVEGASLAELLRATSTTKSGGKDGRPGLSPEEGAYVGVEVCRALDYAHRRMNVVHRDVTPRNVMVDEEGQIKVIDFGIAAPVATAPSGHGVFGSPGHMPPEQMDAKELTPAADVFAVAVLLMELWSTKAPFRRRTREEIEAAMRASHPRPSDVDPLLLPLDDVIASAMALDPAARPQQADDLGRALRRFLAGVDLGDVARHLGDRVRDLRVHPAPPPTEPRPVLQRPPSRPTATQVGTKTFAAREELSVRPPPMDAAEPADAPSTRKIESRPPELSTRRLESRPPGALDAAAMPPLETPARPAPAATSRAVSRTPVGRFGAALLGTLGAGVLAVAAFFLGRSGTAQPPVSAPAIQGSAAIPAVTSPPPPASTEVARPAAAPAASRVPERMPASSAPSAGPGAQAGQAAQTGQAAQLTLLGDGTSVAVDGVPRGACPRAVALDPGPHAVVFTFPPTGESKGESLTLRSGERVTLRADFTGATPSIRSQPR